MTVPTVSVVLGQGCGGGALALLPAQRVIMAEKAWLMPLPPEGASVIVHGDTTHADEDGPSAGGSGPSTCWRRAPRTTSSRNRTATRVTGWPTRSPRRSAAAIGACGPGGERADDSPRIFAETLRGSTGIGENPGMTEQVVNGTEGWRPDPFGRHERRFYDGHRWTPYVARR